MILHTIVPLEQIFSTPETPVYETRQLQNDFIQGVNIDGKFIVSRFISTNPHRYLDPHCKPGEEIKY